MLGLCIKSYDINAWCPIDTYARMGELDMSDDATHKPVFNGYDTGKESRMGLLLIDLDDTLLDNAGADVASFQYALRRYGIGYVDSKNIIKWRMMGMHADTIMYRICEGDTKMVKECMEWRREYLSGNKSVAHINLKEDAVSALRRLQRKYEIVVVTARSHRSIVMKILTVHGIDKYVSDMLCADDYSKKEIKFKDYAALKGELYGLALKRFDSKKEDCVAVGNLKSDIVAAVNMDITAYAVRGSYGFDPGIAEIAKAFKSLSDLADVLLSQNDVCRYRTSL